MSIRTNPMKAVPVLLKRVKATRTKFLKSGSDDSFDGKMEMLTRELTKIEDVFMRVKKNQDQLLDALHEVDGHLRKLDRNRLDKDMDAICTRIRDCAHKLLPMDDFDEDQIVQSHKPSSSKHNNNQFLLPQPVDLRLDELPSKLGCGLVSLSGFPKDAVIKKRLAIYWWIGLGIVCKTGEKTAEEMGEEVIDELLKLNLIVPYGNGKSPIVNKFQIHPCIRRQLDSSVEAEYYRKSCFVLRQRSVMICLESKPDLYAILFESEPYALGLESKSDILYPVFNASSSYLNFESQWLGKECSLNVLQLGRWQDSPSGKIHLHITLKL